MSRPTPREVLARAFLLSMEYSFGKQVEEASENLAKVTLKALKDAGYSLSRRMDADDEKIEDEWYR